MHAPMQPPLRDNSEHFREASLVLVKEYTPLKVSNFLDRVGWQLLPPIFFVNPKNGILCPLVCEFRLS